MNSLDVNHSSSLVNPPKKGQGTPQSTDASASPFPVVQAVFQQMNSRNARALHQAIIRLNAKHGLKEDAVVLYLYHYLQKNALRDGKQVPTLKSATKLTAGDYHRGENTSTSSLLYALACRVLDSANEDGTEPLSPNELFFVASPSFKGSLKMYFDVVEIKSNSDFRDLLDKLIKDCVKNDSGGNVAIVLIDDLIGAQLFSERVTQVKEKHAELWEIAWNTLSLLENTIRNQVLRRLCICSLQTFKNQSILIAPISFNFLYKLDDKKRKDLAQMIEFSGQTPTVLQATSLLVDLTKHNAFEGTQRLSGDVYTFASMQDFFTHPSVTPYIDLGVNFRGAVKENASPPCIISLLSSANTRLLQGLADHLEHLIHNDPKKRSIINSALIRLAHLMQESAATTNDHTKYTLYHELIGEEILLLLNLTRPYQESDFQRIFAYNNAEVFHQDAMEPMVLPFSSGMACVDAILRAMFQWKPGVTIGSPAASYFELDFALQALSKRSLSPVGEKPTILRTFGLDKKVGVPDLLFLTFRQSPPTYRTSRYEAIPVQHIVESMLVKRKSEDPPLSIAVDVTADKLHSKEVQNFVMHFRDEIESGRLNIVLFRSGLKFDQLGIDKFGAGYLVVYSSDKNLMHAFQHLGGTLAGLDLQALCHYHQCADIEIHSYLKLHYKNTQKLYQSIKADAVQNQVLSFLGSTIQLTKNSDKKTYFLEFTLPQGSNDKKISACIDALVQAANKTNIFVVPRFSFGYNESSIAVIGDKIRWSIGTHLPDQIDALENVVRSVFSNAHV